MLQIVTAGQWLLFFTNMDALTVPGRGDTRPPDSDAGN